MRDQEARPVVPRAALPGPRRAVLCEVVLESDLYGTSRALVRNVSAVGAFIEMVDPLPLGAQVRVVFGQGAETIVANGVVQRHYSLNFADAKGPNALEGMGVRFTGFDAGKSDESLH